jgi:hypothetical protein
VQLTAVALITMVMRSWVTAGLLSFIIFCFARGLLPSSIFLSFPSSLLVSHLFSQPSFYFSSFHFCSVPSPFLLAILSSFFLVPNPWLIWETARGGYEQWARIGLMDVRLLIWVIADFG